jgi:hypothetical protein
MRLHKHGWQGETRGEVGGKSAAQGERDGFYNLGDCYRNEIGCEEDVERARENFLAAADLGDAYALSRLLDGDDLQRFVWFGRAAANRPPYSFLWWLLLAVLSREIDLFILTACSCGSYRRWSLKGVFNFVKQIRKMIYRNDLGFERRSGICVKNKAIFEIRRPASLRAVPTAASTNKVLVVLNILLILSMNIF